MFYNFNAHRQKKQGPVDSTDPVAKKIAGKLMAVQRQWANRMDRACRKIPLRWLKLLFVSAGLMAGGFCLYLIFYNGPRLFSAPEKWLWSQQGLPEKTNTSRFWVYLDSLENAVRRDSISHPADYAPLK
jgi:hypothetical protein